MSIPPDPQRSSGSTADLRRDELKERDSAARLGGPSRYRERLPDQRKLPVRERLRLLFDPATPFLEDGLLANTTALEEMGADGVITGMGTVQGRRVCVAANDPTVKAGSWGPRTVEKILRVQELAERLQLPLCYLVDSAGARITEQRQMFPGRRHAGRIFHNQVRLSGQVPQPCLLFGPSAAGGAYIPAFCDVTFMVEGNASMYLGSPRMAEEVDGERLRGPALPGRGGGHRVAAPLSRLLPGQLAGGAAGRGDPAAGQPQRHRRAAPGRIHPRL